MPKASKLTEQDVIGMRDRFRSKTTTVRDEMERFGISHANVYFVVTGWTWKHLPNPIPRGTWMPRQRWLNGAIPKSKEEAPPPEDQALIDATRAKAGKVAARTRKKLAARKAKLEGADMPKEIDLTGATRGKYAKKAARPAKTMAVVVHEATSNGNGKHKPKAPPRVISGFEQLPAELKPIIAAFAELAVFRSVEGQLFDAIEHIRTIRLTHQS